MLDSVITGEGQESLFFETGAGWFFRNQHGLQYPLRGPESIINCSSKFFLQAAKVAGVRKFNYGMYTNWLDLLDITVWDVVDNSNLNWLTFSTLILKVKFRPIYLYYYLPVHSSALEYVSGFNVRCALFESEQSIEFTNTAVGFSPLLKDDLRINLAGAESAVCTIINPKEFLGIRVNVKGSNQPREWYIKVSPDRIEDLDNLIKDSVKVLD